MTRHGKHKVGWMVHGVLRSTYGSTFTGAGGTSLPKTTLLEIAVVKGMEGSSRVSTGPHRKLNCSQWYTSTSLMHWGWLRQMPVRSTRRSTRRNYAAKPVCLVLELSQRGADTAGAQQRPPSTRYRYFPCP